MSGILKRRIFLSELPVTAGEKNGKKIKRFTDWAIVTTGIGAGFEPFTINDMALGDEAMPAAFDPMDMMRRVDEIGSHDPRDEERLVSDGDIVLHAHQHWMRVGP